MDSALRLWGLRLIFAACSAAVELFGRQTKTLATDYGAVEALEQPLDVDGDRYPTMGKTPLIFQNSYLIGDRFEDNDAV